MYKKGDQITARWHDGGFYNATVVDVNPKTQEYKVCWVVDESISIVPWRGVKTDNQQSRSAVYYPPHRRDGDNRPPQNPHQGRRDRPPDHNTDYRRQHTEKENKDDRTLFVVCNKEAEEVDLEALYCTIDGFTNVRKPKDKGFAFVEFQTPALAAEAAEETNGVDFHGRQLLVRLASDKSDRDGGSSRGERGGGGQPQQQHQPPPRNNHTPPENENPSISNLQKTVAPWRSEDGNTNNGQQHHPSQRDFAPVVKPTAPPSIQQRREPKIDKRQRGLAPSDTALATSGDGGVRKGEKPSVQRILDSLPQQSGRDDPPSANRPYRLWKYSAQAEERWKEYQQRRKHEISRDLGNSVACIPSKPHQSNIRHVVIDGVCCYRSFLTDTSLHKKFIEEEGLYDLEDETEDLNIQRDAQGFKLELPEIGSQYFKFIIGSKGAQRDEIEKDTGASVKIPKAGEDGILVIRGITKTAIANAKQRVDIILEKSKDKLAYTHFISIPLLNLKERATKLIAQLDTQFSGESEGVDSTVFQLPARLHLTILMLRLYSPDQLQLARELLDESKKYIDDVFTADDQLTMQGLNYMNDDPSMVRVLYLQVAATAVQEKILKLVDYISKLFIKAGLASDREIAHNEKLHATLMNAKWRATDEDGNATGPDYFDIRELMEDFEDCELGECALETVELSKMGEHAASGYWFADHKVAFPSQNKTNESQVPRWD